eukprot:6175540-Pleurochrysis_carterae.AAC.2
MGNTRAAHQRRGDKLPWQAESTRASARVLVAAERLAEVSRGNQAIPLISVRLEAELHAVSTALAVSSAEVLFLAVHYGYSSVKCAALPRRAVVVARRCSAPEILRRICAVAAQQRPRSARIAAQRQRALHWPQQSAQHIAASIFHSIYT